MFKNAVRFFCFGLIRFLSKIVSKIAVVFTGQSGIHYAHNTKSVFDFFKKPTTDFQFVWATNHKDIFNKVSSLYGPDSVVYIFFR